MLSKMTIENIHNGYLYHKEMVELYCQHIFEEMYRNDRIEYFGFDISISDIPDGYAMNMLADHIEKEHKLSGCLILRRMAEHANRRDELSEEYAIRTGQFA